MTRDEHENEMKRLVAFMASFFWNCATDISFEARVAGNEADILRDFHNGLEGWSSASMIQEPHTRPLQSTNEQ